MLTRKPQPAAMHLLGAVRNVRAGSAGLHVEPYDTAGLRDRRLKLIRRTAVATWALIVGYRTLTAGFAFNRELLLLYIATGLLAASIGRGRRLFFVLRDWLPFALVLLESTGEQIAAITTFLGTGERFAEFGLPPTLGRALPGDVPAR